MEHDELPVVIVIVTVVARCSSIISSS